MSLRLAYLTSHPIQYQAGLFRALARADGVTFKAFFCTDWGLENQLDPGFGRRITWDVPLLEGYDHTFVRNIAPRPAVSRFSGLLNPSIGAALARFGADAVIVHGYAHATMWLAMAQCRAAGIPTLLRGDTTLVPPRPRAVLAAKAAAAIVLRRLVAGAVAVGSRNAEYWRYYGLPAGRVFLAPYSVDNAFFAAHEGAARARALAWRAELGLSEETLVVGFAGKLSPVKGLPTLIEAFGRAAIADTALVIAGDGALRAELERLAARYPRAAIRFVGFRNQSEMPAVYALSDVLVLPSISEAWGLVVNEAMNLGCPLIVSDRVGCAPDLVHPDNGWVFPAGDVAALIDRLGLALAGPDARTRLRAMGAASRRRIATWGLPETVAGLIAAARAVS